MELLKLEKKLFCGRSATARYLDMDEVIENAYEIAEILLKPLKITP